MALLAKQHVNANDTILSNYELDLHISDGQCTASVVMKRFIEIITNRDYKSFVGILGEFKAPWQYIRPHALLSPVRPRPSPASQ